jgi:hypothetical protein
VKVRSCGAWVEGRAFLKQWDEGELEDDGAGASGQIDLFETAKEQP